MTSSSDASRFRLSRRLSAARVSVVLGIGVISVSLAVSSAEAATRKTVKRVVKRPVVSKVIALPPTTAPAPVPLPATTAAPAGTAAPTTTIAPTPLTLTSDVPRRLVPQGGSTSFTLTIASRSPEATTLSVSGLPAGARANLSVNPAGTTSVLTLTTTAGVTPGGYSTFQVQAQGGGVAVTLSLDVVVDNTVPAVTTTTVAPAAIAFAPTAEVLSAGPINAGGGNFVIYRVNLNRPTGVTGAATLSLPAAQPGGLLAGVSESTVAGPSFIVSFSARIGGTAGFYQPGVTVTVGGYSALLVFPVQVT